MWCSVVDLQLACFHPPGLALKSDRVSLSPPLPPISRPQIDLNDLDIFDLFAEMGLRVDPISFMFASMFGGVGPGRGGRGGGRRQGRGGRGGGYGGMGGVPGGFVFMGPGGVGVSMGMGFGPPPGMFGGGRGGRGGGRMHDDEDDSGSWYTDDDDEDEDEDDWMPGAG